MTDRPPLRRAAERAADRPFFLASALLAVARAEQLDDAGLAERLGCAPAELPALLLCRKPAGEAAMFRADVEAIAGRFGLQATRLAQLIRAGDAVLAFGRAAPGGRGSLLAAARDRAEPAAEGEQPAIDDRGQPAELPPAGARGAGGAGHPAGGEDPLTSGGGPLASGEGQRPATGGAPPDAREPTP